MKELCSSSLLFMTKNKFLNHLSRVTCYLLIFLFTYTGISKLLDHDGFLSSILQSPVIRKNATTISWSVPALELILTALLLSEKYRKAGLLFSLFTLTLFTLYIVYMVLFIPNLPCSCGGVLKELSWRNHILFNSVFIVLIITALLSNTSHKLFIAINRISRKPV
jgi:hypothetical protein